MDTREKLFPLLAILALLAPARVGAQVYAQLGPAAIVDTDVRFGAYGLAGEDQIGGLIDGRFMLTNQADFGFQAGLRHFTDRTIGEDVLDLGADMRFLVMNATEDVPVDVSAGAGFGYTGGDNLTMLTTALQAAVSRALATSSGREVTPYAGAVMTIAHTKVDRPGIDDDFSDPDLDLALRLGFTAALGMGSAVTGELQIKEDPAFYLGINTSF